MASINELRRMIKGFDGELYELVMRFDKQVQEAFKRFQSSDDPIDRKEHAQMAVLGSQQQDVVRRIRALYFDHFRSVLTD